MKLMKSKVLTILLTSMCILTSCGTSTAVSQMSNDSFSNSAGTMAATADAATVNMSRSVEYDEGSMPTEAEIVKSNMMVVRDAQLSVDVGNLETFSNNLTIIVNKYDGYFESSQINNYDSDWSTERYAYFTIRIPEKNLDAFLNHIDGEGTVTSKGITTEDVSLEYADTNARIKALETEKENLLQLLKESQDVSDTIEIQNRLSDVQYELDSKNSQKRLLDGRVSYSTVDLNAKEQRDVDNPIRRKLTFDLKEKMLESLENLMSAIVWVITSLPAIIIIVGVAIFLAWLIRKIWSKIFRKHTKPPVVLKITPDDEMKQLLQDLIEHKHNATEE